LVDLHATFQSLLAGRYAIERELGRGGMATVFLATDLEHGRVVALKVMHPELAAVGAARFRREISIAGRLRHPNILGVYEAGEAAGRFWYAMPYVQGESLRDVLRRERRLPVPRAVRIALDAARALDYAHQQGVLHRDVKPENVLLDETGRTLLADFGLARATEPDAGVCEAGALTETGFFVGSATYVSPEQSSGEYEVDGRTDVYGLGCVLFEMLAGEPPITAPTAREVLAKRAALPAPPVGQLCPDVPPAVEAAIDRALVRWPSGRFATAADFARALESALSIALPDASVSAADHATRHTPASRSARPPASPNVNAVRADGAGFVGHLLGTVRRLWRGP
jgi:eukaryotic-like serine/threonine-protein kinase